MKKKHIKTILIATGAAVLFQSPAYATSVGTEDPIQSVAEEESTQEDLSESTEAGQDETGETSDDGAEETSEETVDAEGAEEETGGQENPDAETEGGTETTEDGTGNESRESESGETREEETNAEREETTTETAESTAETIAAAPKETYPEPLESNYSEEGGEITILETEGPVDADGNVVITVTTADDLVLPLEMRMKSDEGTVSVTIGRSGQQLKIRPGEYKVTKATDGNNKKLPTGAHLTIPEEGGAVHLDFNKPKQTNYFLEFLKTNIMFIPIALLMYVAFRWYVKNFTRH